MKVLVANIGSTSLKWRVFDFSDGRETLLHKGGLERVTDYAVAIEECLCQLKGAGVIEKETDLAAVGFKTVIARNLNGCVRLDAEAVKAMEEATGLAPAHNPPYIAGIRLFAQRMPETPLVGLFETAFCQYAPEAARRYAVPESWHAAGVQRWGFHGASHKFIAERSAELLGRADVAERARQLYVNGPSSSIDGPNLRVVSCHLGGSSSVSGILNGVGIGNSMGLTPQSGLPHNNRVGDLDAFAVGYMLRTTGASLDDLEQQLFREAGLKGLSGGLNDVRDLTEQTSRGNTRAQLALDVLTHECRRWIGGFLLELNGLDALVFTAGIGENQAALRASICARLDLLGIRLDTVANDQTRAKEGIISAPDAPVKVMVIPTNEELVVAREVRRHLEHNP
jgi:acetate kinase